MDGFGEARKLSVWRISRRLKVYMSLFALLTSYNSDTQVHRDGGTLPFL